MKKNTNLKIDLLIYFIVLPVIIISCNFNEINITLNTNEGYIENTKIAINSGSYIFLPTPISPEGYLFDGWYNDKELTKKCDNEFIATSNISLYAKYRKCKIQLLRVCTLLENGASSTIYFVGNKPINTELPIPILEGNIFEDWYLDYKFKNKFNPLNPGTTDIYLFPKYRDPIEYEIKFVHSSDIFSLDNDNDIVIFKEGTIGVNPPKYIDSIGLSPQITWCKDNLFTEEIDLSTLIVNKSIEVYGKTGKYIAYNSNIKKIVTTILQETNEETLAQIDTSRVTNMNYLFKQMPIRNKGISDWDVSNVTSMVDMFYEARSFNTDISRWDVSNVTDMNNMFYRASNFNQDISKWNVSNVTDMFRLFCAASNFNQDISKWKVSNVINMYGIFHGALKFNQDISQWDVSNVTNMSAMFLGANLFNQDISKWNVSNVKYMSQMFYYAQNFNQDISRWDVSNVTNMRQMFYFATAFYQNISSWNVFNVTEHWCAFNSSGIYNETNMQPIFFYF